MTGTLPALIAILCVACGTTSHKAVVEDRVAELRRDVRKAEFAIRTTKTLIARSRDTNHVPDLYTRLAELYIEQARYHYLLAQESQKNSSAGVVSVQARLLKNQAVSTYRRLLTEFPNYRDSDKVMFFMGHELRELGEYDAMLGTYQALADRFPTSEYRLEGLLVMGDYYFDKGNLSQAEFYYRQVINSPDSRVHAMASYKLAWCKVNQADYKEALALFERSVQLAGRHLSKDDSQSREGRSIDLRREALVDSVFCFTEVHKPDIALDYFRNRADSKTTYLAALNKLGNRYYVKQDWKASAMIYREILNLSGDSEDAAEFAHRLYESIRNGKLYDHGAADVIGFVRVIRRRYYNPGLAKKDRDTIYDTFEKYARDISTRLHDRANEEKSGVRYEEAALAYQSYLSFFGASPQAALVRSNLAEVLFASEQYVAAADNYLTTADKLEGKERKEAIFTAIASYFNALSGKEKLTRLGKERARAGLRRGGEMYLREFGKDPNVTEVKFNIARTYYDAGYYDDSIRLFTAYTQEYPRSKEAPVAAHLVLDAYRNKEDYDGLISSGKQFLAMRDLGDAQFRNEVAEILKGAEENLLRAETIRAVDSESGGMEKLEELAERHQGTTLGRKALINAFVTARNAKDPEKMFEYGEKLISGYPNDEEIPSILATMGRVAMDSLQFSRGATYLEAAAKRKTAGEAVKLYQAAAAIRIHLGQRMEAEQDLNALLQLNVSSQEKADLAVDVARLHIQANDWDSVIRLMHSAQRAGASSATLSYLLGYGFFRRGELTTAEQHLSEAVRLGSRGNETARESAAAAQFYRAEIVFKAFSQVKFTSDLGQLGATLQSKVATLTAARGAYTEVVSLSSAVWSVAALGRLASIDGEAAQELRNVPLPDGLPPEVVKEVRGALEAQAAPLSKEADEALKECANTAAKFVVLSPAARACLTGRTPGSDPQSEMKIPAVNTTQPAGAAELQRTLVQNPRDIGAMEKLGRLYLANGNPYMARMVLGKGLDLEETPNLLNLNAVALARLGDVQDAYDQLKKAIAEDSQYIYARINTAALLIRYGHQAAAKKELERVGNRAQALSPNDEALVPDALTLIGRGGSL